MYSQYLEWKQDKTLSVWESIQKMLCMKNLQSYFRFLTTEVLSQKPKIFEEDFKKRLDNLFWGRFARFFGLIQRLLLFVQAKQAFCQRPASQFLVNNELVKAIKICFT
jgi:hypothetical protein